MHTEPVQQPIDFLVEEMRDLLNVEGKDKGQQRKKLREHTYRKWQKEWNIGTTWRWTYSIIPKIEEWVKCGDRKLDYFVTHFWTGRGCFKKYTHRIRKKGNNIC